MAAPFLRPLRIARVLRIVRAGSAAGRALRALMRITARRGFQAYLAVSGAIIAGAGLLTWAFERDHPDASIDSASDGLWWAVVTATTVGYGDAFPVTPEGRGMATVLMLVGIGLVGVITANVAAYLVEEDTSGDIARLQAQLDRIESLLLRSTDAGIHGDLQLDEPEAS